MTRAARSVPCCLVLLAAGCGLADYENRMEQAQKRLDRYEVEARVLDDPLIIPSRFDKDNKLLPDPNIYLRPPKGIGTSAENPEQPRARLFYSFKPRGTTAGGVALVEVAIGDLSKEFRADALRCFSAAGTPVTQTRKLGPAGRETTFDTIEFDDGQYFYSVNIFRGSQEQIAIAYWVPLAQKPSAGSVIKTSLETFAVGNEAAKLKDQGSRSPLQVPGHPK